MPIIHSAHLLEHKPAWQLIDALNGGTATMRLGRQLYLPQDIKEQNDVYEQRLSRAVLDNYYTEAVKRTVDKIFTRDISLIEQPTELQLFWNDVDAQGRDGTQFFKEALEKAVHHGVSFVLTDYSALPPEGFQTLREELAASGRPYFVLIPATQVTAINTEIINGREQLVFFQYETTVSEWSDRTNAFALLREIRTLSYDTAANRVNFLIEKNTETGWVTTGEGQLPSFITAIPITCIYANRTSYMLGTPLFSSLAELNAQHYAKRSDLENILHVVNVPFLFGKGFSQPVMDTTTGRPSTDTKLEVDVHNAIMSSNPDADIRWVEHAGSAITVALADLKRLEDRMRDLGAALFTTAPGSDTATATAINSAEANARLRSLALGLQDAIELSLVFVSEYYRLEPQPQAKIQVHNQFSIDFVSEQTFDAVLQLHTAGLITRETVINEARRRNIISIDEPAALPTATDTTISYTADISTDTQPGEAE